MRDKKFFRVTGFCVASLFLMGATGVFTACNNTSDDAYWESRKLARRNVPVQMAPYPTFTEERDRSAGFYSAGKTAWTEGDTVCLQIDVQSFSGDSAYASTDYMLAYTRGGWALLGDSVNIEVQSCSDLVTVTARYAPAGDYAEVLTYRRRCAYAELEGELEIAFDRSESDVARLRIAGKPYGRYALRTSGFRGTAMTDVASDTLRETTVVLDSLGNAFLYGTWTSGARINGVSLGDASTPASTASVCLERWNEGMETGLPIAFIGTPGGVGITSKTEWTEDVRMTILSEDGVVDYCGSLQMKGRGNSTWNYPKKPYALKLDARSEVLGMKAHKRWCLLANWMDRTLMRNTVAFEIARRMTGLDWTPSGRYVELVLNGTHMGNYWLCEQIRVDKNRLDIKELSASDAEVEGGYIMELDTYYDEEYKFKTPERTDARGTVTKKEIPWMFKVPDVVNDDQFRYMQNYVTEMEDALYSSDRFANREFEEYMDLNSFVDYWIVLELAQNSEIWSPKSVFMNKDAGGKMKAGPVWDFDWGTFIPLTTYRYFAMYLYYTPLFRDRAFKQLVKERWNAQKSTLLGIGDFIDETAASLQRSDSINAAMWPINRGEKPNKDEDLSFSEAVARMKEAYLGKFDWLDNQISRF